MDDKTIEIEWTEFVKSVNGLKTDVTNKIVIKREVIPIIFVPGIMGSKLRNTSTQEVVWNPDSKWAMVTSYGLWTVDAADKKKMLIGELFDSDYLEVDETGFDHASDFIAVVDDEDVEKRLKFGRAAAKRGWGGVLWSSYGKFIDRLHRTTWPEPIRHCFELPVHACGYNWTDSCVMAGRRLRKRIDEVIGTYKDQGRTCTKVILATHSMGGLVARAACKGGAEEKVLGVVHVVQPVIGAGTAYWRMKGGFERRGFLGTIAAWCLGTDSKEVTALLGNMPGGLELLPNKSYPKNWLQLKDHHGKTKESYPSSDPYEEIYTKEQGYWRLVNKDYLDPDATIIRMLYPKEPFVEDMRKQNNTIAWIDYLFSINYAKEFHENLQLYQHGATYNIYGNGHEKMTKTADECIFQLRPFEWRQQLMSTPHGFPQMVLYTAPAAPDASTLQGNTGGTTNQVIATLMSQRSRRNNGGLVEYIPHGEDAAFEIELQMPEGWGDGTVPTFSGSALADRGSPPGLGKYCADEVEHEPAYGNEDLQERVLRAIENLCRKKIKDALG
jgi:hypothetical protein